MTGVRINTRYGDIVYVGQGEHLWRVWVIENDRARVATLSGHANRSVPLDRLTPASEADTEAAAIQRRSRP